MNLLSNQVKARRKKRKREMESEKRLKGEAHETRKTVKKKSEKNTNCKLGNVQSLDLKRKDKN